MLMLPCRDPGVICVLLISYYFVSSISVDDAGEIVDEYIISCVYWKEIRTYFNHSPQLVINSNPS